MQRRSFSISGQVQGVGFRPFVFRLAQRLGLTGLVRNGPEGVLLEAQGPPAQLAELARALRSELPPLARISALQEREIPLVKGEESFKITASSGGTPHEVLISPDIASCEDCLADLREEGGRRQRYPFTNCTNCGPRYSITRALPYDRRQTSMHCFPLCPECAKEYADPRNRRFHAQPNACPLCGPQIWLAKSAAGVPNAESRQENCPQGDAALSALTEGLLRGEIAAVKGLGGFHLVCDATNNQAVQRLRLAKQRPHKPFAIMAASLEEAREFVRLGPEEERLLSTLERPIVLCPARPAARLSPLLSPDTHFIGLMLPYTPLHHLLLQDVSALSAKRGQGPAALVMTSGNRGGEPIALGNREALQRLRGIADLFLLHNRDILLRTDDSVLRPLPETLLHSGDAPLIHLRRARGFVPAPLALPQRAKQSILGLGAELKNTICLSRGAEAFVSQHVGDLQNLETAAFQAEIAKHLSTVLQAQPQVLVLDAHPDFASRQAVEGGEWAKLPQHTLQHHFAHAEAVLAENREEGPALVLTLDGTGYAPPALNPAHSLWGGELIFAHPAQNRLERIGTCGLLPLPGGEAAIRQPWRIAHGALRQLGLLQGGAPLPWLPAREREAAVLALMLERGLNTPWSSSVGRLFDAAAALLGLCLETTYEGQAAIRLEEAQYGADFLPADQAALYAEFASAGRLIPKVLEGAPGGAARFRLDTPSLLTEIYAGLRAGSSPSYLARYFHWALAEGLADLALQGSRACGTSKVGLSGGVFQNLSLFLLLKEKLRARGLEPLSHRNLPPNDACISYGQVVWGIRNLGTGSI